jgi:hypothetical protein
MARAKCVVSRSFERNVDAILTAETGPLRCMNADLSTLDALVGEVDADLISRLLELDLKSQGFEPWPTTADHGRSLADEANICPEVAAAVIVVSKCLHRRVRVGNRLWI